MLFRNCAECSVWYSQNFFTAKQWDKGDGRSRCKACVSGLPYFDCTECHEVFSSEKDLQNHLVNHRSKGKTCFFCNQKLPHHAGSTTGNKSVSAMNAAHDKNDSLYSRIYEFSLHHSGIHSVGTDTPNSASHIPTRESGKRQVKSNPVEYHCIECAQTLKVFRKLVHVDENQHRRRLALEKFCDETVKSSRFKIIK